MTQTRTEITTCDECGTSEAQPVNWLHLDALGTVTKMFYSAFGSHDGLDFCKVSCLSDWLRGRR